jgi:hypothetical protein
MSWETFDRLYEDNMRMKEMEGDYRDEIIEPYETKLADARDFFAAIAEMVYGIDDFDAQRLYGHLEQLAESLDAEKYFYKLMQETQEKMAIRGK